MNPRNEPRRPLGAGSRLVKRSIDLLGAATAGVFLLPVMAGVALAVVIFDGRPVLFRQVRPGLGGRPFTILKFRTMRPPRPDEVWYLTNQDRMTRLGRLLRATSLDEMPELWNVLRGDMSLVGPRPLLMQYLTEYTPEEQRRHDVRPGITGWAAVNGRHTLHFRDRLALDVWYVDHWSPKLDIRIMVLTVGQVVSRTNVTTEDRHYLGFPLGPGATAPGSGPGGVPGADTDAGDRA